MYQFLKKYRREGLAVATALLMVAFLLPNRGNQSRGDYVYGRIDGKKVQASEVVQAHNQWRLLRTSIADAGSGQPLGVAMLGAQVAEQIEEHPELFLMLQAEALKNGVYIPEERVNEVRRLAVIRGLDTTRRGVEDDVQDAIRSALLIRESFDRAASAVRVSQPLRDRELATRMQQIRMEAVTFNAADYLQQVPAPTAEEVQKQFDKYKDVDADSVRPNKENPFAFGYRFPDRVQVQYLMVPETEVRKVVEGSQTPERWRVEATKYYIQHQGQFTTTTQPAADPLSLQKPKPVATTRPFAEVQQQATEAVIQPLVAKRQTEILNRINTIIASDWTAYRGAKPGAGESPASSLGVPYNSYEYFQKLGELVAREFKVQLTIGASGSLMGAKELFALEPIGRASTQDQFPFPLYATMTEAYRKQLQDRAPGLPGALAPWQPSQMLRSYSGDAFIFRRTIIDPVHAPRDLSEVAAQVERDVRLTKAFDLAKAAAEQFAGSARSQGFTAAAAAATKAPADTGFFGFTGGAASLQLSDVGTTQFTESALDRALQARAAGQERPVVLAPVQKDGKVVVGQLTDIRSRLQGNNVQRIVSQVDSDLERQFAMMMMGQWFMYDNVAKRIGYEPAEVRKRPGSAEEKPESQPPQKEPVGM